MGPRSDEFLLASWNLPAPTVGPVKRSRTMEQKSRRSTSATATWFFSTPIFIYFHRMVFQHLFFPSVFPSIFNIYFFNPHFWDFPWHKPSSSWAIHQPGWETGKRWTSRPCGTGEIRRSFSWENHRMMAESAQPRLVGGTLFITFPTLASFLAIFRNHLDPYLPKSRQQELPLSSCWRNLTFVEFWTWRQNQLSHRCYTTLVVSVKLL